MATEPSSSRVRTMRAGSRAFVLAGLLVIATAAATVPLPLRVVAPGDLVEVGDALSMRLHGVEDGETRMGPVSGAFVGVRQRDAVPVAALLLAAVDPDEDIHSRIGPIDGGADHPLTRAAMYGVGLSPHRFHAFETAVAGEAQVGTHSLAAALHAFDGMAGLDLLAGRRILALGYVGADDALICPERIGSSVEAVGTAAVDLIVVPTGCAEEATAALAPGSPLGVRHAGSLLEAVSLLGT